MMLQSLFVKYMREIIRSSNRYDYHEKERKY